MSLFLFNFKFNKMIEIKTEEVTKVVEKVMRIGNISSYFPNLLYSNESGDVLKKVRVERGILSILGYDPKINEKLIGWGCHAVSPKSFRKALKELKVPNGKFEESGNGLQTCDVKVRSLVNVVKIVSRYNKSVNKKELIEKMELLLKIHNFLYKK